MFQWKQYELGVCYYPEQWDESLWREDLHRMKEAGIGTVRVAEFCWVIFEPAEGEFHFELFDRFLNLCEEEEIKVQCVGAPRYRITVKSTDYILAEKTLKAAAERCIAVVEESGGNGSFLRELD